MYRRRLLTASGASLAGVGAIGCLGSETEESVFEEITGSGWPLEVSFVEDAQIGEIGLVNPNGDVFAGGSLEVGQHSVGIPLVRHDFGEIQSAYTPSEEYTIAAVDADDEALKDDNEDGSDAVETPEEDEEGKSDHESEELTTITGIGESYSSTLREAGIETVEDLAEADLNSLEGEVLIASTLLEKWIDAARERSNTDTADQSLSSASSPGEAEAVEGVSDDD